MNDFDIVYDIHYKKEYYNFENLFNKVQQIQDSRIAKGLLFDIAVKENNNLLPILFESIPTDEVQDPIYFYNIHNFYVDKLLGDCRTIFEDFIYEYSNDGFIDCPSLIKDQNFVDFIGSLSKDDAERLIQYCLHHEYYEFIDFLKKVYNI